MSSGYGIRGGLGRCYPFFADLKDCLRSEESNEPGACTAFREDYFECLHHKKEYARVRTILAQEKKNVEIAKNGGVDDGGH
ncbi:hypothetical protein CTEN210_15325 [Chaetoceros tenuissimus]|uniref:NADH dehydrogenase [ubiquinone] iron-sulfur protein 5 n=1 Tax=Chaetoceros tenuissimus TaxID=426638 RepID=A0AAD3HD56_9STRA|nr:hypothetical protein CTEN210_15325 [Chaetoceros tenuissimus]